MEEVGGERLTSREGRAGVEVDDSMLLMLRERGAATATEADAETGRESEREQQAEAMM